MGAEDAAAEQEEQGFFAGLWKGSWAQEAVQTVGGWFQGKTGGAGVNPYAVSGGKVGIPFINQIPILGDLLSVDLSPLGINGDTIFEAGTWAKARQAIAFGALTDNEDIEEAVKALEGKVSGIIGGAIGSFLGPLGILAGYFGSGFVLDLVGKAFEAFGKKNPFAPGYLAKFLVDDEARAAALAQAQKMGAEVPEAGAGAQAQPGVQTEAQPSNVVSIGPAFDQAQCQKHGGALATDGLGCVFKGQVPVEIATMVAANDPDGAGPAAHTGTDDSAPNGP